MWWPYVARHQLRKLVAVTIQNMTALYVDCVTDPLSLNKTGDSKTEMLPTPALLGLEKKILSQIGQCTDLLRLTAREPRFVAVREAKREIVYETNIILFTA